MAASTAAMQTLRPITKAVKGMATSDGAGVNLVRTVGTPMLRNLDPYLMLDEIKAPSRNAAAGFPDHPHRGFETCTIMLSGRMRHGDHVGNKGIIGPGGVQWMTAGRGIVHSEFPESTGDELLHGFQLWINLPKKYKMIKPRYQDYQADQIPSVDVEGASVRVMAGEVNGATGPIKMRNPGTLLDVRVSGSVKLPINSEFAGFAYVYEGAGRICGTEAAPQHALVFGPGDHIEATSSSPEGLKFLVIAGRPINEPIVQHGPFVMNTREEIMQAFMDYQTGKLQNPEDDVWADEL